jgi:uncharacterized protein YjdB
MNLFKVTILSTLLFLGNFSKLSAQTQLELSSGSMSSPANGATTANQIATKLENTTGTTFVAYSPTITVTASFSNQQFAVPVGLVSTGTGMVYGASTNSLGNTAVSLPVFNLMNSISSPANTNFTSNPNGTAGTGIDVTTNSGFSFYNSVYPLYNSSKSLNGRYYYGDLTLTFNRPVSDPVLQISGLGGNVNFGGTNIQGFSSELELQNSGLTAVELSGTAEFNVTSNKILNSATTLGPISGSGAASGSVKIEGTNITSITFKVYLRGDGKGTAWANADINAGDVFVIGVSMNKPVTVSGNIYNDVNGLTDGIVNGTGTNVGGALYANLVDASNKVVASVAVGAGGTYSFSSISAGAYTVVLSTTLGTQGSNAPSASLPAGYVNTGEFIGSGAGSDGTINGIIAVTGATTDVTNVNFGIYSCPTITNPSAAQTICIGQSGSNISVNTSSNTASGIKFVRFTSDQIAGSSPTASELAAIYAGTTISTVTPTGGSAPYTATYTWNSADFPNATTSTITYHVYAIVTPDPGTTCRPVQEITVVVNALPVIASITGTTSVCVGQTTTLSDVTASGVWKSVSTGVATVSATGVVTGVSAGTSIIRYTVTNGNGCKDSVATTVTVNALPVIAAITGTTSVCVAKTTTLSSTTTGGVWKSVSTGVATVSATGVVTGVSAGTSIIRYTVTNGNGCVDSVSTTVTVNALPVIAAITGTTTVCVGQTTPLADATASGVWKSVSTGVATINASGIVTGVTAGTSIIRYTITNGNGCVDSVSTTVTVNALPVIAAITGTTTVCVGQTTPLADATASGVWKSVSTGVATINASGVVTGVTAGTSIIRYTITNGNGCVDSVSTTVTVNALPVIAAITGGTTICVAKTTTLSSTTTGGVWKSVSTGVATVSATGVVTGISAGTSIIRYTVTNGNGCVDSVSTTVTANALPVIAAITGGTTICVAKTTTLSSTTTGGVWSSVSTGVATVSATGVVTGISAGTSIIRYTVTNVNGCVDSVSTTVTVNALPVIAAITGGTTICVAKTTQLADATASGVWSSVSTGVATVSATGVVTGVSAGTSIIRYTVTNGNGCVDSVSTTITVNALPVIAAITGGTTICVAKTTQLADATASGVWSSVSTGVATVNSTGLVSGISAGTSIIRYTVTNGNGCVDSVSTTVTVNALPVIAAITGGTTICVAKTTQLADATASGVWSSVSTGVATINSTGLVTGVSAGTSIIRYTVTNGNGCVDSVSTTVTVNALPVIAPITGTTSVCASSTTQLADATASGVWTSTNTNAATVNSTGLVSGINAGTSIIRYTVTNGNGCVDSVSTTVTVNALPIVAPITGNTINSVTDVITLSSTTTGGVWTSSNTSIATVSSSGVVTGVSTGTVTISYTVTNGSGCVTTVTYVITINPKANG